MATRQGGIDTVKSWFLLVRPYSLINIVLIVALTFAFTKGVVFDYGLLICIIMGIAFWSAGIFSLEFLHKDIDGRDKLLSSLHLIISLAVLLLIFIFTAPQAIIIFLLSIVTVVLYSSKSRNLRGSHLLFLFRPFTEIGIIYSVALIEKISLFDPNLLTLSAIVYLISISRNLIGDVRDHEHDKYTLSKRLGKNVAYLVSALFLITLICFNGIGYQDIPLLFILILICLRVNAFGLHRLYIFCTSFYFSILLIQLNVDPVFVILLLFIGFVLYNIYNLVPRVSNVNKPHWI